MDTYTTTELVWIGLSLFLIGMAKGGFPVGSIALPILVLVWPDENQAARGAVSFMLPVLCTMDIIALVFYRRQIQWRKLKPLFPGMLAGVVVASVLFVSEESQLIAVSDAGLKFCIGLVGLTFTLHKATSKWILKKLSAAGEKPGMARSSIFGFTAGITSTLAHAAGPIVQMYLLPQKLPKLAFAGTTVAFFFVLNLVKMVPFSLLGRIQAENLMLGLYMLPVIPVGVALGYLCVRITKPSHYVAFIYTILFCTSVVLILKATGVIS